MTCRIDHPDYIILTVEVGVRTIVSVTVEVRVPRADADAVDLAAEEAVNGHDAKIIATGEADGDTFNDLDNIESLNQVAAEALAEYRATLGGA